MFSVTLPAAVLRTAFAPLGKVIASRTTLPVLSHLRIERVQNRVHLSATDLDRWLTFTHVLEPEPITALALQLARLRWPRESGAVLIPKSALQAALAAVDRDGAITLQSSLRAPEKEGADPRHVLTLGYPLNGSPVSTPIDTLPPDDFPSPPDFHAQHACVVDTPARAAMIEAGQFSSEDETRYVLNGIYLETRHDDAPCPPGVVATDGRRLYRREIPSVAALGTNLILPTSAVDTLGLPALLGHDWKLYTDGNHAQVDAGPWRLLTRLIEGNFPNYRQVIPSAATATATLRRSEHGQLLDVLGKLPQPPAKSGCESITLRFERDRLNVACPHTKASVIVPGVTCTRRRTISLNRHFLRALLSTGPGTFRLIDEMSPLRYDTTRRAVHVLMPMRTT